MISIRSFTENMIKMCNRRSYRSLASVLLVLLLAITLAVSPTHGGSHRCAHPDGTQKGKGCGAGDRCVWVGVKDNYPRCRSLSDDCLKNCKSGYVCVQGKSSASSGIIPGSKCQKLVY